MRSSLLKWIEWTGKLTKALLVRMSQKRKGENVSIDKVVSLKPFITEWFSIAMSCGSHIAAAKNKGTKGRITSEEKQALEKSEKRIEPMGV